MQEFIIFPDFWEFWRMRKQCAPGSPFTPAESLGTRLSDNM